jgi:hypothetical protein
MHCPTPGALAGFEVLLVIVRSDQGNSGIAHCRERLW